GRGDIRGGPRWRIRPAPHTGRGPEDDARGAGGGDPLLPDAGGGGPAVRRTARRLSRTRPGAGQTSAKPASGALNHDRARNGTAALGRVPGRSRAPRPVCDGRVSARNAARVSELPRARTHSEPLASPRADGTGRGRGGPDHHLLAARRTIGGTSEPCA